MHIADCRHIEKIHSCRYRVQSPRFGAAHFANTFPLSLDFLADIFGDRRLLSMEICELSPDCCMGQSQSGRDLTCMIEEKHWMLH